MVTRPYIINVFKPKGISSYEVVRHFKKNLPRPFGKIGHLGTLDPFAEGVLLIALGGAQRMNDFIHQWYPKTYLAQGILGIQTPSGDMTSPTSWEDHSDGFKELRARPLSFYQKQWESFNGEYWQVPPAFSACKFQGKPLHVWASQGVAILKDPVKRVIKQLSLIKVDFPRIIFSTTVSRGTYIRTLFEDMAKKLGTYGALEELKRVSIGPFCVEKSLRQEQWPAHPGDWKWQEEDQVHSQVPLPKVWLNVLGTKRYRHGHKVDESMVERITLGGLLDQGEKGVCWAMGHDGEVLGLALGEHSARPFCLSPKVNFSSSS